MFDPVVIKERQVLIMLLTILPTIDSSLMSAVIPSISKEIDDQFGSYNHWACADRLWFRVYGTGRSEVTIKLKVTNKEVPDVITERTAELDCATLCPVTPTRDFVDSFLEGYIIPSEPAHWKGFSYLFVKSWTQSTTDFHVIGANHFSWGQFTLRIVLIPGLPAGAITGRVKKALTAIP